MEINDGRRPDPRRTLGLGKTVGKGTQRYRLKALVGEPQAGLTGVATAPARRPVPNDRAELVKVLIKLTADVERFDELIDCQRTTIEGRSAGGHESQDEELVWRLQSLGFEAREVVRSARQALEQLRRLSQ
jgi:hypothetical protein